MDMRNSKESMLGRINQLEYDLSMKQTKEERIYLHCLSMVLDKCTEWEINGKKIKNAEGYCKLAKIFARNSIEVI